MIKESASGIYLGGSWISKSVAAFLAGALSIAVGAGALGAAVASFVVLVLEGVWSMRPSFILSRTSAMTWRVYSKEPRATESRFRISMLSA